MTSSLPLLLLDVDGVLNPFAAPACPAGYTEHGFFPGEDPVRLCAAHGPWLQELATRFQIVWATAWAPKPTGSSPPCSRSRPVIDQSLQWADRQSAK